MLTARAVKSEQVNPVNLDEVTIRPFREPDRCRLKELTVEAFRGVSIDQNIEDRFGLLHGTTWQERKAKHIDDDIAANAGGVLVAEHHDEIVGYITIVLDRKSKLGRIPNMAVDERYRGMGLGKRLVEESFGYMRSEGMQYAKIETLDQNPVGQHLYPKMGFVEVARQIHYVRKL